MEDGLPKRGRDSRTVSEAAAGESRLMLRIKNGLYREKLTLRARETGCLTVETIGFEG